MSPPLSSPSLEQESGQLLAPGQITQSISSESRRGRREVAGGREEGEKRKWGGMAVGESVERKKRGVKTERHGEETGGADGEDSGGGRKRDV